ncbi:MAG: imidazole glycerol phosphate synthase subunit HisH [Thermoanaerobaculia bacterium]
MITIVGYGLGNIRAFENVYKRLGVATRVATRAEELEGATHVILPGVGAFDTAMSLLRGSGMLPALEDLARGGANVLGVCVGMQMLAESSEEGALEGLAWIPGRVKSLRNNCAGAPPPLPHMGWNDVSPRAEERLFDGLGAGARFYFLHSYFMVCDEDGGVAATTEYGGRFACAVRRGRIHGVQFHPEKSHGWGTSLLGNFARL